LIDYAEIVVEDHGTRHRDLIRPVRVGIDEGAQARANPAFTPHVCRLLRSGITLEQFNEHFEAIRELGAGDSMPALRFTQATSVDELATFFCNPLFENAVRKTLAGLSTPTRGLWPFLENLFHTYGSRRTRFGVILLLDQFEEIFTRFVDSGSVSSSRSANQPNWRLRWELVNEVRSVYLGKTVLSAMPDADESPTEGYLPLRFVIAMRDEYVTQMDPFREFVPDLDVNAYHLGLLTLPQAEAAIKEPAKRFHYAYSDKLYHSLTSQLTKEERYIEPAHLQIVCEKLWLNAAEALSKTESRTQSASNEQTVQLGEDALEKVQGVSGILESFFSWTCCSY
jgi:hypothetical protein